MRRYIENISILTIFLLFAVCSLLLMILGANQYIRINEDAQIHFETRTPSAYISNKIRQGDTYGGIQVNKVEGKDVLVITETEGEAIYETWIYEYQGTLRELYIQQGDSPQLDWGMEVTKLKSLTMKLEKSLLRITMGLPHEKEQRLIVRLRAGGDQ